MPLESGDSPRRAGRGGLPAWKRVTALYDILIVDDDPTVIVVLGAMLRPLGQVRFAKRARDALRLACVAVPDLVLLDLQLPDGSGDEVCAAMAGSPLLAGVPVLVLSASADPEAASAALARGAREFLPKPPQAERIVPCVRRHLEAALQAAAAPRERIGGRPERGVCNRRRFDTVMTLACVRAAAAAEPLTLLRVAAAQPGADGGLQAEAIAGLLQRVACGSADRLGQLGAEGLAALLPATDADGAAEVAARLLAAADEAAGGSAGPLRIGVATWTPADSAAPPSAAGLLAAADGALAAAHAGSGVSPTCCIAYRPGRVPGPWHGCGPAPAGAR